MGREGWERDIGNEDFDGDEANQRLRLYARQEVKP